MSSFVTVLKTKISATKQSSIDDEAKQKLNQKSLVFIDSSTSTNGKFCFLINSAIHSIKSCFTDYSTEFALSAKGYKFNKKLLDSLQGDIIEVTKDDNRFIVKSASKLLVQHGKCRARNGKVSTCSENIKKEALFLRWFKDINAPSCIIGLQAYFSDSVNYFLIMEHGGMGMFEFGSNSHQLILNKQISMDHWKYICPKIAAQMAESVNYLHTQLKLSFFLMTQLKKSNN